MRNEQSETPLQAARMRVLEQLSLMAKTDHYSVLNEIDSFDRKVREHYAAIHNQLAGDWGVPKKIVFSKNPALE